MRIPPSSSRQSGNHRRELNSHRLKQFHIDTSRRPFLRYFLRYRHASADTTNNQVEPIVMKGTDRIKTRSLLRESQRIRSQSIKFAQPHPSNRSDKVVGQRMGINNKEVIAGLKLTATPASNNPQNSGTSLALLAWEMVRTCLHCDCVKPPKHRTDCWRSSMSDAAHCHEQRG